MVPNKRSSGSFGGFASNPSGSAAQGATTPNRSRSSLGGHSTGKVSNSSFGNALKPPTGLYNAHNGPAHSSSAIPGIGNGVGNHVIGAVPLSSSSSWLTTKKPKELGTVSVSEMSTKQPLELGSEFVEAYLNRDDKYPELDRLVMREYYQWQDDAFNTSY